MPTTTNESPAASAATRAKCLVPIIGSRLLTPRPLVGADATHRGNGQLRRLGPAPDMGFAGCATDPDGPGGAAVVGDVATLDRDLGEAPRGKTLGGVEARAARRARLHQVPRHYRAGSV